MLTYVDFFVPTVELSLMSHKLIVQPCDACHTKKQEVPKHPVGQTKGTLRNEGGVCGLSVGLRALQDASRGPNEFYPRRSLAPKRLVLRARGGVQHRHQPLFGRQQPLGHLVVGVEALDEGNRDQRNQGTTSAAAQCSTRDWWHSVTQRRRSPWSRHKEPRHHRRRQALGHC